MKPAKTTIAVHCEDARTEIESQTVELGARDKQVVDWPFIAGEGNRPYVLMFECDAGRQAILDVTGAILP